MGKRVSQARNLALEHIGADITHCLELIGHSWIDSDHVEKRVKDMISLESKLGLKVGAIGCLTEPGDSEEEVSQWIEGALSSPIGSGSGQFKQFKGTERTKVPAFCLHNVEALKSVEGWDNAWPSIFNTLQQGDEVAVLNVSLDAWAIDVKANLEKGSSLQILSRQN